MKPLTETSIATNEIGTCIGCRLPCWRETAYGCCRKTAALVIAGESEVEITKILIPARTDPDEQTPEEPEIIIGVRV